MCIVWPFVLMFFEKQGRRTSVSWTPFCRGSVEPDQLRQHLADFVPPTNFGRRLKTSQASDPTNSFTINLQKRA